ncbi:alanine--tRNA ligase [Patescibacteria group bacterium]|nr:alanine--tRNA ligase [Patescibacteria group bacterium]
MTSVSSVRQAYLNYFKQQQHAVVPSAPLVPDNDPSTLFTSAGMQPIIPYLMGTKHPLGSRLVNSQKCFRTQDIDEVGDNRHTTFFEMLGNWSLGDYFKKEQIHFVFDFLVNHIKLNPERLYVTIFRGDPNLKIDQDTEAADLWKNEFATVGLTALTVLNPETEGLKDGRIFFYDDSKNWWSRAGQPQNMPVGELGGPDSEIFWDFGADLKLHENSAWQNKPCHPNCDCGRFMEIGNSVFMQYAKTPNGFAPLPQKNIDFGGGLERITAAANNQPDIFKLDVFKEALTILEKLSKHTYKQDEITAKSFRVILDHLRAVTFLLNDNVLPSNKDQGYFTRRLIRRAVRYANLIGLNEPFTDKLIKTFINVYANDFPELKDRQDSLIKEISKEETKFLTTINKGLNEFKKITITNNTITGQDAFNLFASHGFPIEMTEEIATEQGFKVDKETFYKLLKEHQDNSRTASIGKFQGGLADHGELTTRLHTATHLTLQALKQVLDPQIQQKGSNITPQRLRLDFSYPNKITPEQINQVETIVNEQIKLNLPVVCKEMTLDEAKTLGATGVFENKYGARVKVYSVGNFSKEICGGPHVTATGELGTYKITKEEASSAGVRRLKAELL